MPELAEMRLMCDFINEKSRNKYCVKWTNSAREKMVEPVIDDDNNKLTARARGKEMMLSVGRKSFVFTMGMTGNWRCCLSDEKFDKHDRVALTLSDGTDIRFTDPRRFGRWTESTSWSDSRGPCPYEDFKKFVIHVYNLHTQKHSGYRVLKTKPLYELMMDQRFFNGIGNYLRAEILGHGNIDPNKTFKELTEEELHRLIVLCHQVPKHFYENNGAKIQTFYNPSVGETQQRSAFDFYGRKDRCVKIKDSANRSFWMDKKWVND